MHSPQKPTDDDAFDREQTVLGEVWTLLGLTTDVSADGDWIRATLGGRSVFVQRFGEELRAYLNVCAHRFSPLRTADKGNGVIRCGFHHWQYNKDGLATGIPKCKEMFGVDPRELDARLTPVEIATCGALIFGRFQGAGHQKSLADEMGDAFAIIETLCNPARSPRTLTTQIAANWKLVVQINLDDYHLVAVHPDTFGKHGYLRADAPYYYRLGRNSAYLYDGTEASLRVAADECRRGTYAPSSFQIFLIFPNVLVVNMDTGPVRQVVVLQYIAEAHDRTRSRVWYFPEPMTSAVKRSGWRGVAATLATPFVPYVLPFYLRKLFGEDNAVCEGIQSVAGQAPGRPILGRHETRIAWFEEVYSALMADANPSAQSGVSGQSDSAVAPKP